MLPQSLYSILHLYVVICIRASLIAQLVKNPPAMQETSVHLIPGLGRSPEGGMVTHSSILAWRIPWTEELGGLQSTGSQGSDMT